LENLLSIDEVYHSFPAHYESRRSPARGRAMEALRDPWTTVSRLMLGASGGILAVGSAIRRNVGGGTVAWLGVAMLAAAIGAVRCVWHMEANEPAPQDEPLPHHNGARNGHALE
jgi:hypothetical protein